MSGNLSAEIVTTGTEILLGEIVDTNAAWMAQQLREAGVNLYYKTTVGDNEARVRGVIELGLSRSDVIIVSGGLGPTVDDITRQAIANATDCPLELHAGALQTLQERFARFGVTMTDNNRQQAYIPRGAIIIENPVGTAPGFIVENDQGRAVIAVPGVPREMKHLMTETVLPYLQTRLGQAAIIRRRVLHTIGIGESSIDHQIGDLMTAANPTVGLAAHTAQVDIRITARAAHAAEAEALIDQMEATVRQRVGPYIFSTVAEETIEMVVARGLQAHNTTIALLESNTAGQIASRLSGALADANPVAAAWTWGAAELPAALTRPELANPFSAEGVAWLAEG
ncbi:MAG: CinA family nicotinamide mononucleotide deamidase-related protein [Caldilineaceae bacterium]